MTNFKLKNKRKYILAIVAVLLSCTVVFASALVMYQSTATATPTQQLSLGYVATAGWTFYVNEVDQIKYMPGNNASGVATTTFNAGTADTYAFKVVTDAKKVCAVQIELEEAMTTTLFTKFDITVLSDVSGTWTPVTLYDAVTGTTPATLSGITNTPVFIHQALSTTSYYLVQVNYSYDKVDTTTAIEPVFQYTPLPQASFVAA